MWPRPPSYLFANVFRLRDQLHVQLGLSQSRYHLRELLIAHIFIRAEIYILCVPILLLDSSRTQLHSHWWAFLSRTFFHRARWTQSARVLHRS